MSTKLSLTTRKNIKDNESHLQEHLKSIEKTTGIKFDFEIDWAPIAEAMEGAGYKDRVGDMIQKSYMGGLAWNIECFVKDPLMKEAFVEAFSSKHALAFVLVTNVPDAHSSSYSWTQDKSGVLTVNLNKSKICYNSADTGNDLVKCLAGEGGLTLLTRKNIKDREVDRKANLARIEKACGISFDLEVDWPALDAAATAAKYPNRIGDFVYKYYLDGIASNLEKLCKDDMCKEAFAEANDKKLIQFSLVPDSEMEGKYTVCKFDGGVFHVYLSKERICYNAADAGQDIMGRL